MLNTKVLVSKFIAVAKLAGVPLTEEDVRVDPRRKPHRPPTCLPPGKMAVYAFFFNGRCLKVGKVGPNSEARYTSQHYLPNSSPSNLAKSMLKNKSDFRNLTRANAGAWIKKNTDRINFLLDQKKGNPALSLLEAFLHCRLEPRFEGAECR